MLLGQRPYSKPLRALLWLNLFYQFTTLFTVIVNPNVANTVEWFHAWLLVSGALVVGWALGAGGHARLALSIVVTTACVIAALTIIQGVIQYASGDFRPSTSPGRSACTRTSSGRRCRSPRSWCTSARIGWGGRGVVASRRSGLLIAAILLTQSRQALIGLVVAVVVVVIRRRTTGRSRLVFLLVIPAVWLVVTMVIDQIDSQNQFNSVFQRLDWFREVLRVLGESPVFGHGLRYWYTEPTAPYQPPQAEIEVLASAGVVGLIGFMVMWVGVLVVLWRVDPRFGTLAVAVMLRRIVQAQFDLFWVAAQVSIPFVIAGICLGAMAREQRLDERRASCGRGPSETRISRFAPNPQR